MEEQRRATIGGSFEIGVLAEINQARMNPRAYAEERLRPLHVHTSDEGLYKDPDRYIQRNTQEGKQGVLEAISALSRLTPMKPLRLATGLSRSCLELVRL